MPVLQKHENEFALQSKHSFKNLIGKNHIVACIDVRAIFYTHASEGSIFLDTHDSVWITDPLAIEAEEDDE